MSAAVAKGQRSSTVSHPGRARPAAARREPSAGVLDDHEPDHQQAAQLR